MVCILMMYSGVAFASEISIESTNLDEKYKADVTMSIPSEEEQLASDIVFVLDNSSCRNYVSKAWSDMLIDMANKATESGAKIKLSIVNFRGIADSTELTEVNNSNVTSILEEAKANADNLESNPDTSVGKGSNLHSGLLEAEKVLASDSSVDKSRKYVIVISDGNTYTWLENGVQTGISFANSESAVFYANPESISVFKNSMNWSPEEGDWSSYFESKEAEIQSVSSEYGIKYSRDDYKSKYITTDDSDIETVQVALYNCLTAYMSLLADGYNCYAINADTYGYYGGLFMNYLNSISTSSTVDFNQIKNDILYYMGKGSYVENHMGYVEGDYNFDLDTSKDMKLVVTSSDGNSRTYTVKYADGSYTFVDGDGEECTDYSLEYFPAGDEEEKFVWTFNKNVSSFERLALTYTIKLMNPKKANPGEELTFGTYDMYGTQNFDGLYTNNNEGAKLHMKVYNSATDESTDGDVLTFNRPTVSYTVSAPAPYYPVDSVDPEDDPIDPHDLPDDDPDVDSVDPPSGDNDDDVDVDPHGGSDMEDDEDGEDGEDISAEPNGVKTSDSSDMAPWAIAFGTSVILLGGAVTLRRREE